MDPYTEHEKLMAISDKSQAIGEFLDWMASTKKYVRARYHKHTDGCLEHGTVPPPEDGKRSWPVYEYRRKYTDEEWLVCGLDEEMLEPAGETIESLLAEYFHIDLNRIEQEKRQVLKEIRHVKS